MPDQTDLYLKDAIEAGLLAADVSHDNVTAHCEAEKCTWKPYYTLGICSQVEDARHMLVFNRELTSERNFTPPHVPVGGEHLTHKLGKYLIPSQSTFHAQGKFFGADRYQAAVDGEANKILKERATQNNPATNLPDLAQVYLSYLDPCLGDYENRKKDTNVWTAHKATFDLCVQSHNSTYNASGMHTRVISQNLDLTWTNETNTEDPLMVDGPDMDRRKFCAQPPDSTEKFCIPETTLILIGGQIATTLDIKADWGPKDYHYYSYALWAPNIGRDVLGLDPGLCTTDPSRGIKGFEHRIKNIAASLTNA